MLYVMAILSLSLNKEFQEKLKTKTMLKLVNAIYFSDYVKMSSRSQRHIIK